MPPTLRGLRATHSRASTSRARQVASRVQPRRPGREEGVGLGGRPGATLEGRLRQVRDGADRILARVQVLCVGQHRARVPRSFLRDRRARRAGRERTPRFVVGCCQAPAQSQRPGFGVRAAACVGRTNPLEEVEPLSGAQRLREGVERLRAPGCLGGRRSRKRSRHRERLRLRRLALPGPSQEREAHPRGARLARHGRLGSLVRLPRVVPALAGGVPERDDQVVGVGRLAVADALACRQEIRLLPAEEDDVAVPGRRRVERLRELRGVERLHLQRLARDDLAVRVERLDLRRPPLSCHPYEVREADFEGGLPIQAAPGAEQHLARAIDLQRLLPARIVVGREDDRHDVAGLRRLRGASVREDVAPQRVLERTVPQREHLGRTVGVRRGPPPAQAGRVDDHAPLRFRDVALRRRHREALDRIVPAARRPEDALPEGRLGPRGQRMETPALGGDPQRAGDRGEARPTVEGPERLEDERVPRGVGDRGRGFPSEARLEAGEARGPGVHRARSGKAGEEGR